MGIEYEILKYFEYGHLLERLQAISKPFHDLAHDVANRDSEGDPETYECLRKLLEAKDCAVRAALNN